MALLTQSGALGIIEIENLKNAISSKVIVSYGNQPDVDPCDLINVLSERLWALPLDARGRANRGMAEIVSTGDGRYLR